MAHGFSVDREQAWLRKNAHAYPGCWLAVLGDELIAADPNLARVLEQMRTIPNGEQSLLHRQPGI